MQIHFEPCLKKLFVLEGIDSNDPDDKGGETRFGISQRFLDSTYPGTKAKDVSREFAGRIYYKYFWQPQNLDQILDGSICYELFECGANQGTFYSGKHAQIALNLTADAGLPITGHVGLLTTKAANSLKNLVPFLKSFNGEQYIRYKEIIQADPGQLKYFVGWLRRISYE